MRGFYFRLFLTLLRHVKKSMGQPQSTEAREGEGQKQSEAEEIPYTKYSQNRPSKDTHSVPKGVTVVSPKPPKPGFELRAAKPVELYKLDKIHKFWPILRSSIESMPPQEKITDGLGYKDLLSICLRYQEHLSECSNIVAMEQKALASRLKDLEMFSAGIAQQMIRRQERMSRVVIHLQKVNDVTASLERIQATLDHCVPMVQRLNTLLPEQDRLEYFRVKSIPVPVQEFTEGEKEEEEEEESDGDVKEEQRTVPF